MWKSQWKWLAGLPAVFLACFFLPAGTARFDAAVIEALGLVKWYAREHVLLCLVPALFIAGAISVFVSRDTVLRYLGPTANKVVAYLTASVSGGILAVCSCTILPLFAGIYKRGAGLGPAVAFLYSGPAINIMAVVLTARVLGVELGVARAVGAVSMSVVIGLCMHALFRGEVRSDPVSFGAAQPDAGRSPAWQNALFFAGMVAVLLFANWGGEGGGSSIWNFIRGAKWMLVSAAGVMLGVLLIRRFKMAVWKVAVVAVLVAVLAALFPANPLPAFTAGFIGAGVFAGTDKNPELNEWIEATWDFTKKIMPLLLAGVFVAGLLLGRVGHEGLVPGEWITTAVGGNSLRANFVASFAGAFMYFATLTEVPILEGLLAAGMGKGPALALLLAGPALSLPSMLVVNGVLGFKKTAAFVALVVVFSTAAGFAYGML